MNYINQSSRHSLPTLPELTRQLKDEDQNFAKKFKRVKIIYRILIPIYLILGVMHIIKGSATSDIIGNILFMLAMLIFAIFFATNQRSYNRIDYYSLPTLDMLKKAETRYRPFKWEVLWLLLAIGLMDAGLTLNSSLFFSFLNVQIYFGGAMLIAFAIGLLVWKVKYQKLHADIVAFIKEIEQGN